MRIQQRWTWREQISRSQETQNPCSYVYCLLLPCLKFNARPYSSEQKLREGAMMLVAKLSTELPTEQAQRRKHDPGVRTSATTWIPHWLTPRPRHLRHLFSEERCHVSQNSSDRTQPVIDSRARERDWPWNIRVPCATWYLPLLGDKWALGYAGTPLTFQGHFTRTGVSKRPAAHLQRAAAKETRNSWNGSDKTHGERWKLPVAGGGSDRQSPQNCLEEGDRTQMRASQNFKK